MWISERNLGQKQRKSHVTWSYQCYQMTSHTWVLLPQLFLNCLNIGTFLSLSQIRNWWRHITIDITITTIIIIITVNNIIIKIVRSSPESRFYKCPFVKHTACFMHARLVKLNKLIRSNTRKKLENKHNWFPLSFHSSERYSKHCQV